MALSCLPSHGGQGGVSSCRRELLRTPEWSALAAGETGARTQLSQSHSLDDLECLSGTTMLPYMPFVSEYWPYIIAGIICYAGAKFMYHSAVSWNPNPGEAQNDKYQRYESPDEGTLISHSVTVSFFNVKWNIYYT